MSPPLEFIMGKNARARRAEAALKKLKPPTLGGVTKEKPVILSTPKFENDLISAAKLEITAEEIKNAPIVMEGPSNAIDPYNTWEKFLRLFKK